MHENKVKIVSLEIENVKRVQAVNLTPAESGLTVIGGDNRQGKSSCLDAIMAALGGEKFKPSDPVRGGTSKGQAVVTLSNGVQVTRSFTGKGSYLKVDSPDGMKTGQSLLNEFVSAFALDLSSFLVATDKARAEILLEIIGVDLTPLDEKIAKLEADRLAVGRLETKAKGHAESMPYDEAAGNVLLTPSEIMAELQAKISKNAKNRERRNQVENLKEKVEAGKLVVAQREKRVQELEAALADARADKLARVKDLTAIECEYQLAIESLAGLQDDDTTALKQKLTEIDAANARVRQNLEREKALAEVEGHHEEYLSLQHEIEAIRDERKALLDGAKMPLPGLTVEGGILAFNGHAWDCMSHAEQLMAATAICRAINPKMGFVLIDKLETMDLATLKTFGTWLEEERLQAIATRVSKGGECSIVISDGMVEGMKPKAAIKFD